MKQDFTQLQLHSSYSLRDSTINIDKLIKLAKKHKVKSLAITDYLNMFAAIKFYQKCIDNNIKPIIGCQIPLKDRVSKHHLGSVVLLCQNISGYKNLIKLISQIHIQKKPNENPGATIDLLKQYNDHILLLSGGRTGFLGNNLLTENPDKIINLTKLLSDIFHNRMYLQIDRIKAENEDIYNNKIIQISEKLNLPLVATNSVLFLDRHDFDAHEVRVCINKKIKLDDRVNQKEFTEEQYFKSEKEMTEIFKDIPDAMQNLSQIIKRCNIHISSDSYHLPNFNTPDNTNIDDYFDKKVKSGLQKIIDKNNINNTEIYFDRLKSESDVIRKMGFVSYFLIVHEFIDWAKKNSIPVGPGRGSGAGSLVAYALDITSVDPIQHNLLFERFLNPERISMPDFDIDFCMINRQKIIDHITDIYGENKVSQIITYGSLSARAVIRDVGRVLGMGYTSVDRIAKMIPFSVGITIDDALKQNKDLRKEYDSNDEIKNLIDTSKKLEGLPRNVGKHAAGIVVAPDEIDDFIPLYRVEESDEIVTQYDKDDIEKLGLVKFDILGLRTLSIIDKAIRSIKNKNSNIVIRHEDIGVADKKVFSLLQKKLTSGVFQLESSGMKRYMERLKPDCFDDIVALVALYRPGPLGTNMVDDFINNKHGRKIDYEHPLLESVLSETYGLILYQEQVMEISRSLAGYSLGEADLLRRAMGKKKKDEMELHRKKFIDGAQSNKISATIANSIFSKMEKFAGYGFNKSHSVAYAFISYQTAYLKTYHTSEFLSSALSSDMDNTDKVISLVDATNEMGLIINQPNINTSEFNFVSIDDKSILFGLGAIKGVGQTAVEHILDERKKNGGFKNLFDFCERVSLTVVNIGTIDSLIYSGAFDCFNEKRLALKNVLDKAMKYGQQKQTTKNTGQHELFENKSESISYDTSIIDNSLFEDSVETRLKSFNLEKKVLGFYLSGHPVNEYRDEINSMSIKNIDSYFKDYYSKKSDDDYNVLATISGMIINSRIQRIGQDRFINILTLDDSTHRLEIIIYPDIYEKYRSSIRENELLFISGAISVDDYNGDLSMKAHKILDLDAARQQYATEVELFLSSDLINDKTLLKIISLLEPHKNGKCPLIIKCLSNKHIVPLNLDQEWFIDPTSILINNLSDLLGKENIVVKYH